MTEPSLTFISKQMEQMLSEQRQQRKDLYLLREEVRMMRGQIARLEDAITMDIMDRLRALEKS
jgi:polyhydroxyalkanoate synthesis regulator phasin